MGVHVVDDFLCYVADGAHSDNDPIGIRSAVVVKELVVGAQFGVDLIHVLFYYSGQRVIVLIASLTMLEEDIAVFVRAAHGGAFRVQAVLAEGFDCLHIAHFL